MKRLVSLFVLASGLAFAEKGAQCGKIVFDPAAKRISWYVQYGVWDGKNEKTFKIKKQIRHYVDLTQPFVERKGSLSMPIAVKELMWLNEKMAEMLNYTYAIEQDFQNGVTPLGRKPLEKEIEKQKELDPDDRATQFKPASF